MNFSPPSSKRRLGCCALCNFHEWVVPNEEGRNVCEDTETCQTQQIRNHEVAVRAELITEMKSLCDEHLASSWGFSRVKGERAWTFVGGCARCAEEEHQRTMDEGAEEWDWE